MIDPTNLSVFAARTICAALSVKVPCGLARILRDQAPKRPAPDTVLIEISDLPDP